MAIVDGLRQEDLWDVEAAARYITACETIRGEPFVPDTEEPQSRLRRNLGL